MPKKRVKKHGRGRQLSAGTRVSTSQETSDQMPLDCDELPLWKIGECLNARQARVLGVKLGVQQTKLENLYDKVQKDLCSQEEMNFEMLHVWNANQIPDDDPRAQLSRILIRDLEISENTVQKMFVTERSLWSTGQESVLGQQQLYETAEKVDKSQYIPLVLRLSFTFNDLQVSKHLHGNHPVQYLLGLLCKWQKHLPSGTDQIGTLSNILAASGQKLLACNIRKNSWGVTNGIKGKSMIFGSETPDTHEKFCGRDLNVSACSPAQFEQISSKLIRTLEKCEQKVELSSLGEASTLDESVELKKIHDQCQDRSRFLTRIQEAVMRKPLYDLESLTIGSVILHVRVYSEEGLKRLMEDIHSGDIGRRLAKVFMMPESDAPISDDAILDITLEAGPIDQISQQTSVLSRGQAKVLMMQESDAPISDDEILDITLEAGPVDQILQQTSGISPKKMEDWDEAEVKTWLTNVLHFPEDTVNKFHDVDGFTLIHYTKDDLKEDYGFSVGNCRKFEYRRQEHLKKEGMAKGKVLSTIPSLIVGTEGPHTSEFQDQSKREVCPVTDASAIHARVSSGKGVTEKSNLEAMEKAQSGGSSVSMNFPKDDVKPKVKDARSSKLNEENLAQLLIGAKNGRLDESYYPVLIANAPAEEISSEKELNDKFGFISSVNWNVVFDFNPKSNDTGLCSIVNGSRRIKILNPKDFQTKDYDKQKEDIEFPDVPVWLFPNGRLDVKEDEEEKLSNEAWTRDRYRAVSKTVHFFSDPEVIPPGRAVVIFLLLSDSDIMVMTQIFREFYSSTSFPNFTVLAEDEKIMQKWIQSLETQEIVESIEMKSRCLSGVPWQEINTYMLRLLGSCETASPQLPISPKGACMLEKKHQSQWTDISVLARNECENTSMDDKNPNFADFVREKEEQFYQGHEVDWWNFHLSEGKGNGYNHVLQRESFITLLSKVKNVLKFQKKDTHVRHISLVSVFHEPGSGGTTVAKNVLWDLHKDHRCAVVNRITNDTVNQIMTLRRYSYEKSDKPTPVVILLENLNAESLRDFLMNLEKEAKNVTDEGLAVLLLHCKRTNEPENFLGNDKNQPCVGVHHKLMERERDWFKRKIEDLEERGVFSEKDTPEQLLAFMVMKEECRPEYMKDVVRRILPAVNKCSDKDKKALVLLKYIAAMHKYCIEFAMPVSACDQYMQKNFTYQMSLTTHKKKRPWEKERPKFLKLLVIEVVISDIDGCVKGLAFAHYTLAAEILSQLCKDFHQTSADIFLEFLMKSCILDTVSHSKGYIKKTCRNVMVRRMKKQHEDETENFSPLIEDVYKEDKAKAFKILEVGVQKFEDPFIAQQKARLHSMYDQDYEKAEHSINIGLDLVRGKNSYLWDTKGIILREKMVDFDQTKGKDSLTDVDIKTMLQTFEDACSAFQKSQSANAGEADHNNGAFLGEIITIFKFLGLIEKRIEPFSQFDEGLDKLRLYLTTDYIPGELISPALQDEHSVDLLKGLIERVETVLGCVTDFIAQCAWKRFHTKQNNIVERKLEKIYHSRHHFFGLSLKKVPYHQQEPKTANAMRRAEVTRLIRDGYRHIFEMASTGEVADLKHIQALLKRNLESKPYLFDVRSLVFVSFALSVCSEEHFDEDQIRHWVQILNELEQETDGFYGLFFEMMLNWPDRKLKRSDIRPIKDTIQELGHRWSRKYNPKSLDVTPISHKRSRVSRKVYPRKPIIDFYLGRQDRFRLIHRSMIGMVTHATWEEEEVKRLLSSLEGVLDNNQYLTYNSHGESMKIRLSLPIQGLPSREPVTFFLGFSSSGPLANGVRYRDGRKIQFLAREARVSLPQYIEREICNADDSGLVFRIL